MPFEVKGKVIEVGQVQQVSDKFRKREFVLEVAEQGAGGREFVDFIKFQCVQDRCELVSDDLINTFVKVSFNLKGNKWERDGKINYFTNLDAWRIERVDGDDEIENTPPPLLDDLPPENEEFEDLPF